MESIMLKRIIASAILLGSSVAGVILFFFFSIWSYISCLFIDTPGDLEGCRFSVWQSLSLGLFIICAGLIVISINRLVDEIRTRNL